MERISIYYNWFSFLRVDEYFVFKNETSWDATVMIVTSGALLLGE
jgi:hypothetical protein